MIQLSSSSSQLVDLFYLILTNSYFQLIISAFFGGLFAGLFSDYFESQRRIHNKRRDKYYDHRNSMVQIEHEILPTRVNISRNINSLENALQNTNQVNRRIVLRFFKLKLSPGLNLNLLNLQLINLYSEVYSKFESINNDIDYINEIVERIEKYQENNKVNDGMINLYIQFSNYLLTELKIADSKSLTLLAYCKSIISINEDKILQGYIKNGGQVNYDFNEKVINDISNTVTSDETRPPQKGEVRPSFITPFLDLRSTINEI